MKNNHLFLRALKGENVERPPVWMMRQAGRYLPEYQTLKKKYDFFTRIQTPELACEITLQPIRRFEPDAAIIFSDILVIPQAMGLEVQMIENKGPVLPKTIENQNDLDALQGVGTNEQLSYVFNAIRLTKKELQNCTPLIGFAGAPFTILCYMVEGKGSKSFDQAKQFCFAKPHLAHQLLQKITDVTIEYLLGQVEAGVDCLQIFDSWSGLLSPKDFEIFAQPYLLQISNALESKVPVILFPKGSWYALEALANSSASALGIDWCISPSEARKRTQGKITLQGNYDPNHLFKSVTEIEEEVNQMILEFGVNRTIINLGHGILPQIPVEHAQAFIQAVKNFKQP